MRMLGFLLQKEFIQIFRDKTILLILFLITTILLFILPPAIRVKSSTTYLSVVDHDRTGTSANFLRKLTSSNQFQVGRYVDTYTDGLFFLAKNKVSGVLEIPKGFEKGIVEGRKVPLMLEIDAVNGVTAGVSSFYFLQILKLYVEEYALGSGVQPGFRMESGTEMLKQVKEEMAIPVFERINLTVNHRYNPDGKSSLFQIPSILAILVCIIGTVVAALNIVTEKENSTIEQMNVSPVKRSTFIFSKIIPSWVIGMAILTLGLFIVWMMYGIVPQSSYWSIYFVSFFFVVSMVGLGVLISTVCQNQQQVMLLCFFFLLIICLLCGMWTPIDSMPGWAQVIADINPLRYYIQTMRLFFAYGSELKHVLPQMGALCIFIIVFNGWAIWNFRKAR